MSRIFQVVQTDIIILSEGYLKEQLEEYNSSIDTFKDDNYDFESWLRETVREIIISNEIYNDDGVSHHIEEKFQEITPP